MGNLFFVPSHHDFDKEGIKATKEMLDYDLWPILNYKNETIDLNVIKVYKDAFNALTKLSPCWAKVSMEVDVENQCFRFPKRVWGQVYYEKDCIIQFSHTKKRSPFRVLTEWPEIMNPPCSVNYQGWDVECQKVIDWSSTQSWNNFFKSRIMRLGHSLLMEGAQLVMNAQIKFETSTRVFSVVFELVK